MQRPINLAKKFAKLHDHRAPRIVAERNDYQFKLVRFRGDFVRHSHTDTDGRIGLTLRGRSRCDLAPAPDFMAHAKHV